MKEKRFNKASEIKVGVVGYGGAFNMGRAHLLEMKAAGMTPVAVAEVDEARLAAARADFPGIGAFSSVDAMLAGSDIGLVVLITPHNTHAPLALKCLRAGRHVVCEKPLAITTAEVDAMISAAKKSGVMLSTYHNRHWDGRIRDAVRRIRRQGVIGDIVRIECHMGGYGRPGDWWRTSRSISGGILYDWGVHLLEYSMQLIDAGITEVSGFSHEGFWAPQTRWKDDCNEDEAFCVVRFDSGQWLTLRVTSIDAGDGRAWLEVTGTKGAYVFDGTKYEIHRRNDGVATVERGGHSKDESARYYRNVRDHLVKGTPLVISAEWSRRPIHVLDLAARSAKQGRALRAKYA